MPYTPATQRPSHDRSDLVEQLVNEMNQSQPPGTPGAPDIRESPTQLTDRYDVWVIWDSWEGVPFEERGQIILEAYVNKFGAQSNKVQNMSYAVGVTHHEADKLHVS